MGLWSGELVVSQAASCAGFQALRTGLVWKGWWINLRRLLLVVGVVFGIALVAMVGNRVGAEAMAVVVGVICGVAAGIPTSALLLLATDRRDWQRRGREAQAPRYGAGPPVVVIQGGASQALPPGRDAECWPSVQPPAHTQRPFHAVGDDDRVDGGWR
jgi:anti-sigma factor RsiW